MFIKKLIYSEKIEFKISRHNIFWLFIALYFISCGYNQSLYFYTVNHNFIFLPINIITTYIILYSFLPRYFADNKFSRFIMQCFFLLLIYSGLNYLIERSLTNNWVYYKGNVFYFSFLLNSKIFLIVNAPAVFIRVLKQLHILKLDKRDLEIRNTETKMSVLTAQLHPHFLFNTLNNLYLLSLEKSDKTPDMIMRLSEIMRYILDDRDKKLVKLTRELEVIKSYIEVERLRYDNQLRIDANIDLTDVEKTSILIPPLLIFTLVENAFKHGVSKSVDNPWINIEMCQKNATFNINIGNSVDECCCNNSGREGVGLKNVQRRLELYYPEQNKYSINKMRDKYIVNLEIKMNNENKLFDCR